MTLPDFSWNFRIFRERGVRGWLAWKLIEACARLYPPGFFYTRLWISRAGEPETPICEGFVQGDLYGGGIWSTHEIDRDYEVHWHDYSDTEFDQYLEDEFQRGLRERTE